MQTPFDTLFEQVQPDATEILAAPFLVSDRISKRAQLFYRVFRKLSYVNQPGFLWRSSAIRIPAFSFSKRTLTFQHPFLSRSPISGRTAFFVFSHYFSVPEKGRRTFFKSLFPETLPKVQSNKPGMNQTNICKP